MFITGLVLAFFLGFYFREVRERLEAIKNQLEALRTHYKAEADKKKAGFGDVMTKAELQAIDDEERIRALNPDE